MTRVEEHSAYEQNLVAIVRRHIGHTALVQGYHEREITEKSLQPGNAAMSYGGFVVHCKTCDVELSEQWS